MGTTQTTGAGPTAGPGLKGRIITAAEIEETTDLEGDKVRVKLKGTGEVLIGRRLPDGRIIRGADVIVPGS